MALNRFELSVMDYFPLFMFPALLIALLLGFPVALSMMGISLAFGYLVFREATFYQFVTNIDGIASNFVLAAVPLFVFMGSMLERSGVAERLFEAMHLWTRRIPGGLALSTIFMCVVFAASTGVVGATEVVVGLLAIPVMMKYKYDKELISGTICAGGSLGTIIPPSVVVVILGPVAGVSVADLFVGMIFPGLIMAIFYLVYIFLKCKFDPQAGPAIPKSDDEPSLTKKLQITCLSLLPPMLMIIFVLGSILFGLAAPTEAAALGSLCAILLTFFYRTFSFQVLKEAVHKTLTITCMIMFILMGGSMFTGVFITTGGGTITEAVFSSMGLGAWGTLSFVLGVAFIAGLFLDWISVVLIFIPIFISPITALGFHPVWFCVLFLVIIQTSYLTPPMAPAIFYLRGISPPEITLSHMFRGVVPFIAMQLLTLVVIMLFPEVVLWLPRTVLGFR